jgi:hypothetical protein
MTITAQGALPVVRYDIFPASVTVKDTNESLFQAVRVVVTMDRVYIFNDSQTVIYSAGLNDGWEISGGLLLEPDDGTDPFLVRRSGGCGCGSRLKSFRPWNGNYTVTNSRLPSLTR